MSSISFQTGDIEYIEIEEAKRSSNLKLATTARDHQIASYIRWVFSKTFWALNFFYFLLFALHVQGWLGLDGAFERRVLSTAYGAYANVLFVPGTDTPDRTSE